MRKIQHSIILEIKEESEPKEIPVRRYNNLTTEITVRFTEGGETYALTEDITAKLRGTKPDMTQFMYDLTVSDNAVIFDITEQMLAVPGRIFAEIALYDPDGNQLLTSPIFYIYNANGAFSELVMESTAEYQTFIEVIKDADKISAKADQATQAAESAEESKSAAQDAEINAKGWFNNAVSATNSAYEAVGQAQEYAETAQAAQSVAQSAAQTAQAAAETKADGLEQETATGKTVAVTDSAKGKIIGLSVYGESEQDGTPTPEAPVAIESVENPVVGVYGKNLITADLMNLENWTPESGTNIHYEFDSIPAASNGDTFTFSFGLGGVPSSNYDVGFITFEYSDDDWATKSTVYMAKGTSLTASTHTFTTVKGRKYRVWRQYGNMERFARATYFQLESGAAATAYEPYKQPQTVTVPYTFRGLKDTKGNWVARDELRVIDHRVKIVRNIKSLVITSDNSDYFSFVSNNVSGDIVRMVSYKNGPKPLFNDMTQDASKNYVLCNLFTHYKSLQASFGYEGISGTTYTGNIYINVSLTRIGLTPDTTASADAIQSAFWNWIKDKGCEIEYILAESAIEDITDTEAGQALLSLYTNYPNTTVLCDADCALRYKADTTIAYNNLLSRISALEAAAVNQI